MANNIDLRTEMVALLDEVFKEASKTSILDTDGELIKETGYAKVILILLPKISTDEEIKYEYEPKKFEYDRYKKFTLDTIDDQESGDLAFGKLASEFIRTKVVPEVDAMRICTYAKVAEANGNKGDVIDLSTQPGSIIIQELNKAMNFMDEAEVPVEGRILFTTPTVYNKIENIPLAKSKVILYFEQIIEVPEGRMNMDVQLNDNGFTVNPAKKINFLIARKDAVIQIPKHTAPKYIPFSLNNFDSDVYTYRNLQIAEVRKGKESHIYVSAMA